jgi:hypothetical protein
MGKKLAQYLKDILIIKAFNDVGFNMKPTKALRKLSKKMKKRMN